MCNSKIKSHILVSPDKLYCTFIYNYVGCRKVYVFINYSHDLDICKVVILGVNNMYLVNQSMKQNL